MFANNNNHNNNHHHHKNNKNNNDSSQDAGLVSKKRPADGAHIFQEIQPRLSMQRRHPTIETAHDLKNTLL
jgi:hypothetical protein